MARLGSRRATQQRRPGRVGKLLLTVGFLSVALGVLVARLSPAQGYELDIYRQTPLLFWLFLLLPVMLSLFLSLSSRVETVKWPALFLGGLSMTAVLSLPIIRGYVYYGLADSLTHLGWAKEIQTGVRSPFEFIYPGAHLTAIVVEVLTGKALPWAMMLVVLLTIIAYFLFVPLAVRTMVTTPAAVVIATFSAFLVLPVNNVATHRMFHPYTMATLLAPLVLYLVFKHVTRAADDDSLPSFMSGASLLIPIVGTAMLFFHPQATLDVIIVLATAVGVQVLFRWLWPSSRIASNRVVYGQVLILSVVFVVWIFQFWQTWSMAAGLLNSFMETVSGDAIYGQNVNEAGDQGSAVGISLFDIFLRLFLVSAVYCVLAASLVVAKLFRWIEAEPERDVAIAYFAASGATLTPFFLLHFVGDISGYFFRHVGFAMVLVTVLGAAALALLTNWASDLKRLRYLVGPAVAIVLAVSVVLAGMAVYPSPYGYKRGHAVSEPIMSGYETTFKYSENGDYASRWATFGAETGRYDDAIYPGKENRVRKTDGVSSKTIRDLVGVYAGQSDQPTGKVPVTEATVRAETEVFRGLRYNKADFESLDRQEGVHRVHSNEEFSLYYVEPRFNESSV